MKRYFIFSLFILTLIFNCDSLEKDQSQIIWGKSIEGIAIDDLVSKVIRILGNPHEIAYLDKICGEAYIYNKGKYNGLQIHLCNTASASGGSVGYIGLNYPYNGTNKDGIGIGSTKKDTRLSLGNPDKKTQFSDKWDFSDISWHVLYSELDTTIEEILVNRLF